MKLKKLNHMPYQDVVVSAGRNALKLQSFQIGTFGTEVTTRPYTSRIPAGYQPAFAPTGMSICADRYFGAPPAANPAHIPVNASVVRYYTASISKIGRLGSISTAHK
jgi:hypothetical protein